ncbi:MAG: GNAT family N-acetyltransferase [Rickettsiaceae bacterium]|nr:MAG: GNAT family N-acetyltransferase [Rickettsiaceae bacterium]
MKQCSIKYIDKNSIFVARKLKFFNIQAIINYLSIRWQVYINEYKRSMFEEFELTDLKAQHYIFTSANKTIGIARVIYEHDMARISRIAILKNYRGYGFGQKLVAILITQIQNYKKIKVIKLIAADESLLTFYNKFGFENSDLVYFDDIPYISMIKHINEDK